MKSLLLGVVFGLVSVVFYLLFGNYGIAFVSILVSFLLWWLLPSPPPVQDIGSKRGLLSEKYSKNKVPQNLDAVIIGSGMSGLTTAAVLSRFGYRVLVLEQHDIAGGGTHTFDLKGFKFDSGLHYTVPWHGPLFQLTCLRNDVPECDLLGDENGTFDVVMLGDKHVMNVQLGEKHLAKLYKDYPEEKAGIDEYKRITDCVLVSVKLLCLSKFFPLSIQNLFWKLVPKKYHPSQETAKQVLERTIKNKTLRSLMCSLWIDSGGWPDEATLMLTGAVQRGLPLEGGCYPRGGSDVFSKYLVSTILQHEGKVLVEAPVSEILVDEKTLKATGVKMKDGTIISANLVISSAGYHNTYGKLLNEKIVQKVNFPRQLPVKQSPGFIMCNVGIKGDAKEMGLSNANIWYLPIDKHGDIFGPLSQYVADPLKDDIPFMITWPSLKDSTYLNRSTDQRISCQMLAMSKSEWFEKYKNDTFGNRSEEYKQYKSEWEKKFLEGLYKVYPKVKGNVVFSDVSTPLTISHYLATPNGGAVGLDQTPLRFSQPVQQYLDISSPISGLWMTGQDVLICGVTLAQLAGVITACRIMGFKNSVKLFLQSIVWL
eukprot:c17106_g1_i1.p1 GENE.c17106_g1_i1~~c17106_g1_i1.p1  ORF type:complete len:596 (+),score=260.84 c17106_g1_i1:73-1860(+)